MGASTKIRPRSTGRNADGGAWLPLASEIAEVCARRRWNKANIILNRRQGSISSVAPAIESLLERKRTPEWALAAASDPVLFASTVVRQCCLGGTMWEGHHGRLLRSLTLAVVLAGRLIIAALLVALSSLRSRPRGASNIPPRRLPSLPYYGRYVPPSFQSNNPHPAALRWSVEVRAANPERARGADRGRHSKGSPIPSELSVQVGELGLWSRPATKG